MIRELVEGGKREPNHNADVSAVTKKQNEKNWVTSVLATAFVNLTRV